MGRNKLSIKDLSRLAGIIEKNPELIPQDRKEDVYYFLGKAYWRDEQRDKAKSIWKQLEEKYPESEYIEKIKKILEKYA